MSVIRVKHQTNYVVINKLVLEDPNLSFKAKGLWAYCMSRPDDWEFHVNHLATVSQDGKDAIYSAIKELENEGYVRKIQANLGGKFGPVDYEISEIKIILPQRENPDAVPLRDFPHTGNPPLLSIDCLPSIEEEVVCPNGPVAPILAQKMSKKDLSGKEIISSVEDIFKHAILESKDWTTEEIKEAWDILNAYQGKIHSHFRFIDGTIDKIRTKRKFEKMKTQTEKYTKVKEPCEIPIPNRPIIQPSKDSLKRAFPDLRI